MICYTETYIICFYIKELCGQKKQILKMKELFLKSWYWPGKRLCFLKCEFESAFLHVNNLRFEVLCVMINCAI